MLSTKHLNGLRKLRLRILDDVAFIKNAVMPVHVLEAVDIVPNDLVRGDHDVVGFELRQELVSLSRIAGVEHGTQVLGVLEDLVVPVARQRRRADDERGKVGRVRRLSLFVALGSLVVFAGQDANRL